MGDHVVYHRYNAPPSKPTVVVDDGRTHQEFALECDINRIMARYLKTGLVPMLSDPGRYGDFSEAATFHEAHEVLNRASVQFASLPSGVREMFRNEPARFLEWVHNQKDGSSFDGAVLELLTPEARARIVAERVVVKSLEVPK
ncbi:MAG: internal scaffolding protein [Microvirus sp.]|nr:MAG: internal scaffolding protein [Microvirus sp.]